jgi:hypothetical protein
MDSFDRPAPEAAMPSRPTAPAIYRELIRRSIDLRWLYRHVATLCEPGLQVVLGENVQVLDLLIADMQEQCASRPIAGTTGLGRLRQGVGRVMLRVAMHRDHAWIDALARHEGLLLHAFEEAIAAMPAQTALTLRRQLPRLRSIALDMRDLGGTARY